MHNDVQAVIRGMNYQTLKHYAVMIGQFGSLEQDQDPITFYVFIPVVKYGSKAIEFLVPFELIKKIANVSLRTITVISGTMICFIVELPIKFCAWVILGSIIVIDAMAAYFQLVAVKIAKLAGLFKSNNENGDNVLFDKDCDICTNPICFKKNLANRINCDTQCREGQNNICKECFEKSVKAKGKAECPFCRKEDPTRNRVARRIEILLSKKTQVLPNGTTAFKEEEFLAELSLDHIQVVKTKLIGLSRLSITVDKGRPPLHIYLNNLTDFQHEFFFRPPRDPNPVIVYTDKME